MEITGRLTADAVVRTVSEDTKVVGFTVAVNDSYKSGEERRGDCELFRVQLLAQRWDCGVPEKRGCGAGLRARGLQGLCDQGRGGSGGAYLPSFRNKVVWRFEP
jgi:hypothetical protein